MSANLRVAPIWPTPTRCLERFRNQRTEDRGIEGLGNLRECLRMCLIHAPEGNLTGGVTTSRDNIDTSMPQFTKMRTWTEHLGHSRLRSFTDQDNHFWLEQNPAKASKWAKLARRGHEIAWEFESAGGPYTGRMLIDGEIYTPAEAVKKFLSND